MGNGLKGSMRDICSNKRNESDKDSKIGEKHVSSSTTPETARKATFHNHETEI